MVCCQFFEDLKKNIENLLRKQNADMRSVYKSKPRKQKQKICLKNNKSEKKKKNKLNSIIFLNFILSKVLNGI